jgi:hypothetical protein
VGNDAWMIKLDGTGNILWQRAYGGSGTEEYQVGTFTFGTYFPINTSMIAPWCTYNKFIKSRNGGYFFALETTSSNGDVSGFHYNSKSGVKFDIWVVKLNPENITATSTLSIKKETMVNEITMSKELLAYPNPFISATTIRFTAAETGQATVDLLDVNGATLQTLFNRHVTKGQTYFVQISNSRLPKAVYIYRIKTNGRSASGKLIKK